MLKFCRWTVYGWVILMAMTYVPAARAEPAGVLSVGDGWVDPVGFDSATPTFSWKLPAGAKAQTAYRIEAGEGPTAWDSGWVTSGQSTQVPYGGKPLASRQRLSWRVNVRDEAGRELGWSAPAALEVGLLSAADWHAKWIRPEADSAAGREAVVWLRRTFAADKPVARARLYVTARGLFELNLNGLRVGRDHFANGWTVYKARLDTLTYDVTDQIRQGDNDLHATLGTGWYAGRIGWNRKDGDKIRNPELLLQLEIAYADGTTQTVSSDEQWQGTATDPIVASGLYDGETYDARREAADWGPVIAEADLRTARLSPKPFPPVRHVETLSVQNITEPKPGHYVFDLGQNMVGWAKLHVPTEKDGTITVHFAEMLNADGTLYTANYRSAKSTDQYTAAATGTADWEPSFTFHGFRYVELTGLPKDAKPQKDWVSGIVLHSDLTPIGTFTSSNAKLNQLQSNIVWGQRGNFVDIPTDCPQRDERLGWTGDAQVFCPTSMFNYDCAGFWKSWLGSMRDDQLPDGRIPHVIPDVLNGDAGAPGWMDAATLIPWNVYVRSGDTSVLADNLEMMKRLVGWYRGQATDGITTHMGGFGDWLQPYAKDRPGDTSKPLLGTAYYARSAQAVADAARVLGRADDAKAFDAEAAAVRLAFTKHFFDSDGKLQNADETQTGYVLAIAFDLIPPELRPKAAENLVRLVKADGDHLRTGFLGTPHIVRVLDETGHPDLAYTLLLQETYPSWFYSINQGATTMWERWNSYSHENGFGDASMNSFNHYAYGAIGQWMVERVAGLAPDPAQPGYKHLIVRPLVGGGLTSARAELETPYGRAASGWTQDGEKIGVEVTVPPNATATIELPDGRRMDNVEPGTHKYDCVAAQTRPADAKP